jgi:hypothetical protein
MKEKATKEEVVEVSEKNILQYWGVGKEGPFFIFYVFISKSKKSENEP